MIWYGYDDMVIVVGFSFRINLQHKLSPVKQLIIENVFVLVSLQGGSGC